MKDQIEQLEEQLSDIKSQLEDMEDLQDKLRRLENDVILFERSLKFQAMDANGEKEDWLWDLHQTYDLHFRHILDQD